MYVILINICFLVIVLTFLVELLSKKNRKESHTTRLITLYNQTQQYQRSTGSSYIAGQRFLLNYSSLDKIQSKYVKPKINKKTTFTAKNLDFVCIIIFWEVQAEQISFFFIDLKSVINKSRDFNKQISRIKYLGSRLKLCYLLQSWTILCCKFSIVVYGRLLLSYFQRS